MILKIKKRENPYVQVDKSIIDNPKITWKAKGILIYLLARPDDWEVYPADIVKHATDGRDAVYSGLNELIGAGYIVRNNARSEGGKYAGKVYEVREIPVPANRQIKRLPAVSGKSVYGKTVSGKSDDTNTYSTNIDSTNISSSPTPPASEEEENVKNIQLPLPAPFNGLLPVELEEAKKLCKLSNLNLQEQAEALKAKAKDNPTNYLLTVLRRGGFAGAAEVAARAREAEKSNTATRQRVEAAQRRGEIPPYLRRASAAQGGQP